MARTFSLLSSRSRILSIQLLFAFFWLIPEAQSYYNLGMFWRTSQSYSSISGFTYINSDHAGEEFNGTVGAIGTYNNKLYLAGQLYAGTNYQAIYVYEYNGNDAAPGWTATHAGTLQYANNNGDGWDPTLIEFNGSLFAAWAEPNGSGTFQIRAKKYNGTTWSAADAGALNVSATKDADVPTLMVYNNTLYLSWNETDGTHDQVHVAKYNGGTSWSRIDDNGAGGTNGTTMNYSSSADAITQAMTVFNNKLYLAFAEDDAMRVKTFDGTSWSSVDGGSGISGTDSGESERGSFATLNGKLYLAFLDDTRYFAGNYWSTLRVMVYGGGSSWSFVDGAAANLNYDSESTSTDSPSLVTYQGRLYVMWSEDNTLPAARIKNWDIGQTRMRVYNGNDASPQWSLVGVGEDGIEYDPWAYIWSSPQTTATAVLNNKLYTAWDDRYGVQLNVYKTGTTPTKVWFPSADYSNHGPFQSTDCIANIVRTGDSAGGVAIATSNVTVTLSGTGYSFFSDAYCSQPLTNDEVTILSGESSAHFWMLLDGTGTTFTLTGAATGLTSGTQTLNVGEYVYVWTGGNGGSGCNGNWSDQRCWTYYHQGVLQGINNGTPDGWVVTALFNGQCLTFPCSATIDVNIDTLSNIWLQSNYTGTVTAAAGVAVGGNGGVNILRLDGGTFTASSSTMTLTTFVVNGGTFNGNSSTINSASILMASGTFNGNTSSISLYEFNITGGSFTSTSGTVEAETIRVAGTPTFNASGGTFKFTGTGSHSLYPDTIHFNNVIVEYDNWAIVNLEGILYVDGTLTVNNDANSAFEASSANSLIVATGDVIGSVGGFARFSNQYCTTLKIAGNNKNQLIDGGTSGGLPSCIEIASTGTGTVTFANTILASNWKYTSGTVNASNSTVTIQGVVASETAIDSGTMHFNNLTIAASNGSGGVVAVTGTVYVDGNMVIDNDSITNTSGGTFSLAGNLSLIDSSTNLSNFIFRGGNAQTYTRTAGSLTDGSITINKTVGTSLSLASALTAVNAGQALTVTSGTLDLNGKNLTGSFAVTNDTNGTIRLKGNESVTIQGGAITANAGSTVVYYATSDISAQANPKLRLGPTYSNLTFNGVGGVWGQNVAVTINGNLTITNGQWKSSNNGVTVGGNWSNSGTYTPGTNTVTLTNTADHSISGTTTFNNLTMSAAAARTLTFPASTTTTVSGALTLSGTAGSQLRLRSSSSGTIFTLNATGAKTTSYLDVQDSTAQTAITIGGGAGTSVNSGNNSGWTFP